MNIKVFYSKEGDSNIPLLIKMHNESDVFYHQTFSITENSGSIDFFCDWPFRTVCYLDFCVSTPSITYDYMSIERFWFDDLWDSKDLVYRGRNIPDTENSAVDTECNDSNSIFYTGTLRYTIPPRPILNMALNA